MGLETFRSTTSLYIFGVLVLVDREIGFLIYDRDIVG